MQNLQTLVQSQVNQAVDRSSHKLLGDLEKLMAARFDGLKDITDGQRQFATSKLSAIKEIKYSETPAFKKKGCEAQYKYNQRVGDHLAEAHSQLQSLPDPVDNHVTEAKQQIIKGLDLDNTVKTAVGASLQNPDLERLAEKLPIHLIASRSDNTVKKYYSYFKRWDQFIRNKGEISLPGNPVHVALFVTYLLEQNCSPGVISSVVCGIKWAHSVCGHVDPTSHPFVINLLETSKRHAALLEEEKIPCLVICYVHFV
ncbi:uncharacterized protein [Ptychodera flava]|uniref:uncharacterized protein n=1 Tax=Ptychodera flava TaxID=63121 RepID=UPI00396A6673